MYFIYLKERKKEKDSFTNGLSMFVSLKICHKLQLKLQKLLTQNVKTSILKYMDFPSIENLSQIAIKIINTRILFI